MRFDNLLNQIIGDATFELRHRILNMVLLIFSVYLSITAITNFYIEENPAIMYFTVILAFVFAGAFYLARIKRLMAISHFVAVFTIFGLIVYHRFDGGISCGTGFYMIAEATVFTAIFRNKTRVLYLSLLGAVSSFLIATEYVNPQFVLPISESTCLINNTLGILLTTLSTVFLVYIFAKTYTGYAREKEMLSLLDPLTGLLNRRAMKFEFEYYVSLLRRNGMKFCLLMFDIDDFKKINDSFGHNCGDKVLISVSDKVKNVLKQGDLLCRWGGEEFLAILPFTDLREGRSIAERVRKTIENAVVDYKGSKLKLTVTASVLQFDINSSLKDNLENLDKALYRGKKAGKNVVVIA